MQPGKRQRRSRATSARRSAGGIVRVFAADAEEGAYWAYATDEQRSQAGCIAASRRYAVNLGIASQAIRKYSGSLSMPMLL